MRFTIRNRFSRMALVVQILMRNTFQLRMTFLTHGMQSWDPLSLGSTMTRSVPIGCQLQKPRAPTAYGIWPLLKNPHTSPYWNASPSESSSEPLSVSLPWFQGESAFVFRVFPMIRAVFLYLDPGFSDDSDMFSYISRFSEISTA